MVLAKESTSPVSEPVVPPAPTASVPIESFTPPAAEASPASTSEPPPLFVMPLAAVSAVAIVAVEVPVTVTVFPAWSPVSDRASPVSV